MFKSSFYVMQHFAEFQVFKERFIFINFISTSTAINYMVLYYDD